jgi:ribulose kinase
VVHNTQRPESTLKKKSNSICYHAICESVAMGESLIGHCLTKDNMADLATKCIGGGMKRDHLVGMLLHDIVDVSNA